MSIVQTRPARDHNNPPELIAGELSRKALESLITEAPARMVALVTEGGVEALATEAAGRIAEVGRAEITDDHTFGLAGTLKKILVEISKEADAKRRDAKKPFETGAKAVDNLFRSVIADVTKASADITTKMDAFHRERMRHQAEERRRLEDEARARQAEADRLAAENAPAAARAEGEAAALAARAREVPATRVESDLGQVVYGRTEWIATVTDYDLAFRAVKDDPKVREAIDGACKRRARAGVREIPGVTITADSRTAVR